MESAMRPIVHAAGNQSDAERLIGDLPLVGCFRFQTILGEDHFDPGDPVTECFQESADHQPCVWGSEAQVCSETECDVGIRPAIQANLLWILEYFGIEVGGGKIQRYESSGFHIDAVQVYLPSAFAGQVGGG